MPIIIEESDAKLIRRIKSAALWSWVATLFFGAISWTARVSGHSFVSNLAFAAIWLGVATFIACVLLLMLAAIILAFTRGRRNDGA